MGSFRISLLMALLAACSGDAVDITDTGGPTISPTVNDPDNDGDGFTVGDGDCNDRDRYIFPGAIEICDGADTNCNNDDTDESGVAFKPPRGRAGRPHNRVHDRHRREAAGGRPR